MSPERPNACVPKLRAPRGVVGGGRCERPANGLFWCRFMFLFRPSHPHCAMVSLVLPPADHLWIGRNRGPICALTQRCRSMTNVCARTPAGCCTGPELRTPGAAPQTRMVSVARIRLGSWESARAFKGIICDDVSEFESYMPSHAVGSLWRVYLRAAPFALTCSCVRFQQSG